MTPLPPAAFAALFALALGLGAAPPAAGASSIYADVGVGVSTPDICQNATALTSCVAGYSDSVVSG